MNTDKIDQIVEKLEKRAKSYNLGASLGFFKILIIFAILGFAFYSIGFPEFNKSNLVFGIEVAFNLTLKLSLVVFAFYYIKLQMAVVAYNIALSNDLFAKAEALTLYSPDGNVTLKELYEHLNVNNHKFSVKNEFSGNKELESLLSILKKQNNESVKPGNK